MNNDEWTNKWTIDGLDIWLPPKNDEVIRLHWIQASKISFGKTSENAQWRYKREYHKMVKHQLTYQVGQTFYPYRSPIIAVAADYT